MLAKSNSMLAVSVLAKSNSVMSLVSAHVGIV